MKKESDISFKEDVIKRAYNRLEGQYPEDLLEEMLDISIKYIKKCIKDLDTTEVEIPYLGDLYLQKSPLTQRLSTIKGRLSVHKTELEKERFEKEIQDLSHRLDIISDLDYTWKHHNKPLLSLWNKSLKKVGIPRAYRGPQVDRVYVLTEIANKQNEINEE